MPTLLAVCILACSAPDASTLLKAYVDSERAFEQARCRIRFTEYYYGPNALNGKVAREGTHELRHDGHRWRSKYQGVARFVNDSRKVVEIKETSERAVPEGKAYIEASCDDKGTFQYALASFGGVPKDAPMEFTDEFAVLFGRFHGIGTRDFADVLRDSHLEVHPDASMNGSAWRLDSKGEYGHASVWFDSNLQVRRIQRIAKDDDLVNTTQVSALPPVTKDSWRPSGRIVSFDTIVDFPRLGESNGMTYPSEFIITRTEHFQSGATSSRRYEGHIEDMEYAPSFAPDDFSMTLIPDHAHVQVDDSPNIEYEWLDNQIAVVVNELTERRLRYSYFGLSYSALGYFVLFALLLIAAVALGMWILGRSHPS